MKAEQQRLAASVRAGNVRSAKKRKNGGSSQVIGKKKTQGGGIPVSTPTVAADEYKVPMKTMYLPSLTAAVNRKPATLTSGIPSQLLVQKKRVQVPQTMTALSRQPTMGQSSSQYSGNIENRIDQMQ